MEETICLTPERTNNSSTDIQVSEMSLPNVPRTVYLNNEKVIIEIRKNDIIIRFDESTNYIKVKNEAGEFEINNMKVIVEGSNIKFKGFSTFKIHGNTLSPSSYQTPMRVSKRESSKPPGVKRPKKQKINSNFDCNYYSNPFNFNQNYGLFPPPPQSVISNSSSVSLIPEREDSIIEDIDNIDETEVKNKLESDFLECNEKYDNIKNFVVSPDRYKYKLDIYEDEKKIKSISFAIKKNFYKKPVSIITDESINKKFCITISKNSQNMLESILKGIIYCCCGKVSKNEINK